MRVSWHWPGARWWRVDLHTHSAASYDFGPDADRTAKDWAAWVAAAEQAGLSAVALTDHNTPDGVSEIQAAVAGRELVVFPGVEVTVGGVHLLCVLDSSATRDAVVALLTKLGIEPGAFGKPDASSTTSIMDAIGLATGCGALVIAAHVNGPRGLLTLPPGQDRLKALKARGLLAAEISPVPLQADGWLEPSAVQEWLDGTKSEGRVLPRVWCSDSHGLAQAGRRFTWVKMTRPNHEGLRLALLDGAGSLRPADAAAPDDPNRHADSVIESIVVREAKYMGRKRGTKDSPLTVTLNPWFNAVIGGRGTGKSTLVDLVRRALRREDELKGELQTAFDKRMRTPASRQDEGLLTNEVLVEVTYRKDGERFLLSWDTQGKSSAISRLDGAARIPEEGDIPYRFPARIYSQKQLFDLAREPNALLAVVDDSKEVRGAELARQRNAAEARYLSLSAELRALRAQAAQLPTRAAELVDVRRKLDVLQGGAQAKTLNEYRTRRRQDGAWTAIQKTASAAVDDIERTANAGLDVPDLELGGEADKATQPLVRAHEGLRNVARKLKKTVLDAVAAARVEAEALDAGLAAWRATVEASEDKYRLVTEQLATAGIGNPGEYGDLLQRAAELEKEIAQLEQQRKTADERTADRAAALDKYRHLRGELTTRRVAFATGASGDLVKVDIAGYAARDALEDELRDALGVRGFDEDYTALLHKILPPAHEAAWTFDRLDALVALLRDVVADPEKRWETKDRRFETALRKLPPERLDRVALIHPDDSVGVSFRDPRDGSRAWRSLAQGSPGQQTAALLAFVLGYGHEPIFLDQPEDDLDNTLIYELLVRRIREIKPARQVVVVTHNPNIVVHGDAELVVSLESRGGQTQIAFAGGLQEEKARDEICRVMEGGREAFETRYRRIMLSGSRNG